MLIKVLDVLKTHVAYNTGCAMRIAKNPRGEGWYCVDCGLEIEQQFIEVDTTRTIKPVREK